MNLTQKDMSRIREKAHAKAEAAWFGNDHEGIRARWHTLASYQAFVASCALRDAYADAAKKARK